MENKNLTIDPKSQEPQKNAELIAWHWYDFTCPFCYVSKSRNNILKEIGFNLVQLPFQAHPDVPAEGIYMGERQGPMYDLLAKEAKEANLPLHWPVRLPNSRYALALAEQVRRHRPGLFINVKDRLYAAHFALGEDLGAKEVVHNCLKESGIKEQELEKWLEGDKAFANLLLSQNSAESIGVRGTPAWVIAGQLVIGLQSRAYFQQFRKQVYEP
ncbi:MAG TPA: DsbA family protein [Chitinophaga sp.]|uniref:DsbA family oxidoreductase n=1 Tax=Chitinophaga sp. TaxID=1869181 RepID=UPI002DBEBA19|nr:DsbA family protein [Chitinophaga sp.]HEU4553843.1 DsbA family protein [Chitinophaga sp.]